MFKSYMLVVMVMMICVKTNNDNTVCNVHIAPNEGKEHEMKVTVKC